MEFRPFYNICLPAACQRSVTVFWRPFSDIPQPVSSIHSALEEGLKRVYVSAVDTHRHALIFRSRKKPAVTPLPLLHPNENRKRRLDPWERALHVDVTAENKSSALWYPDHDSISARLKGPVVVDATARREEDRVAILHPSRSAPRHLHNLALKPAEILVGKNRAVPLQELSPSHRECGCPSL